MSKKSDDILAFGFYEAAGHGDNLQGQIRETSREPDGLPAIRQLLGGSASAIAQGAFQGAAQGGVTGGTAGAIAGALGGLRSGAASYANVMPKRPPKAKLEFPAERERVKKRLVLPEYVEEKDTYEADVIETTVPRLMTHEPCVEHRVQPFEDAVDPKGRLQDLLKEYVQYRNVEEHGRFDPP